MITDKEITAFWNRYDVIIISWGCVSFFFIASLLPWYYLFPWLFGIELHWAIWFYYLVVPVNFLLKYGLGIKRLWFFNDTADGDFGDPNLLKKYGLENKPKWFRFIWWTSRNITWNYISKFKPEWNNGQAEDFRIIKSTITNDAESPLRWTWCDKYNTHGMHYIAARINGKVVCRYSTAGSKREKQMGAGGDRYILHLN